jgi:hypothetical protein
MQKTIKTFATKVREHKIVALVVCAALLILASSVGWHAYAHRYIPGKITFQEYQPTYWPSGLGITNKTINATYVPAGSPPRYTELVLEMSDGSIVYESERKDMLLIYKCPDGKITNQTCTVGHTDKGEPYLLFTTTFEDGATDQSIEWSRQDTNIHINFKNLPENGYSQKEIEKIIQSFETVEYKDLEIRYIDRSVI